MSRMAMLQRQGIRSRDPAEITCYLSRTYGSRMHFELLGHRHGDRLGLRHGRVDGGAGFAIEDVTHDGDVETRGEPTSGVVILWPTSGRAESHVNGGVGYASQGEVLLGSTSATPLRVRTCEATLKSAVIEPALLAKAAADLGPETPTPVRFTGPVPVSPKAGDTLTAARRYVEETVLTDDAAGPLVLAAAGRLLAAAVLSAFPHGADLAEGPHDRNDHQPVLLRRAMSYIEDHAAAEIGVADVASAVYVTPRALQYMFRRHLDSTPMAYLRRVRLDHVHRALIAGDRGSTTVTAAAARWGFAHTGRFAVLYRETYGQSPHVTLRH
jgi:AraC-like DNA-binding protein